MSFNYHGYQSSRGTRGRGGSQNRSYGGHTPSAKLQEGLLNEVIASISVPSTPSSLMDEVKATNVVPLGSYNWTDHSTPTIIIPGTPPSWEEPRLPLQLEADVGETFIDQNAARLPTHPLEPLLRSVNVTQQHLGNNFSLANENIDIVTDRNGLRKLMKFITFHGPNRDRRPGRNQEFRIDAQLAPNGRTLVLTRHEEKFIDSSTGFKGYGHNFEKVATEDGVLLSATNSGRTHTFELDTTGYHRVIRYDLLGLRFLVRFEVDAMESAPGAGSAGVNHRDKIDELSTMFARSSVSRSKVAIDVPHSKLRHVVHGSLVPQNRVMELKCVKQVAWTDVYPQLFLSRTPILKVAKHSQGYVSRIQTYNNDSDKMQETHEKMAPDFVALVEVLKRIRDIAEMRSLDAFALYWSGTGDLKLRAIRDGYDANLLSAEELAAF